MNIFEDIKVAALGLKHNKMRSFLTMLGIIIGISSVIGISTIGRSLSKSVSQGFDSFGNTSIQVYIDTKDGYDYDDVTSADLIKDFQIEEMQARLSDKVKSVSLTGPRASGSVKSGKKVAKLSIESVSAGEKDFSNIKMLSGRFIEDDDIAKTKELIVISDKVVKDIFDGKTDEALGSELEVQLENGGIRSYLIVGVYIYEKISFGIFGGDPDDMPTSAYIPLSVGNRQFASTSDEIGSYYYFAVSAKNRENLQATADEISKFFNYNYYKDNERVSVATETLESAISEVNKIMGKIKLAIGAIAAISLLVGGIGVMNILLVSVTERTKEIGIRKALGATNRDIKSQFIIESIIICIIGGVIGVVFGSSLGYLGSLLLKSPTLPSMLSVIIAVAFSMFIGVFFGYYPSNKAAKLDPIDALRYE